VPSTLRHARQNGLMSQGPPKDDKSPGANSAPPPLRAELKTPPAAADARPTSRPDNGPGASVAPPPLPRSPQPVAMASAATATAAAFAPLATAQAPAHAPAAVPDPVAKKPPALSGPPLILPQGSAGPRKATDKPGPVAPKGGPKVVEVGAPPVLPKDDQPTPKAGESTKTPSPSAARPPALPPPKKEAARAASAAAAEPEDAGPARGTSTRSSRRRPAGPSRAAIAANDDVPSIGGLIYALQQKPSQRPMMAAAIASGVWAFISLLLGWAMLAPELQRAPTFLEMLSRPTAITLAATVIIPIALFWFLAMLVWRAQELRLMSSAMTEVAIRLAEPDRMAEQQIASVGQAVRRQVSFMNEAVSRALGRAGELEALVHSEVAALERAYSENEHRIRGLLTELSGERHALLNTSERVNQALKEIGTEIPSLVDKLGQQQMKLAGFIEGAGQNLIALETSLATTAENVSVKLGDQTSRIETVFEEFTTTLAGALEQRTDNLRLSFDRMSAEMADGSRKIEQALDSHADRIAVSFDERSRAIDESIAIRTENLHAVFEQYASALDATMARRQEAIDRQLIERTQVLDDAFSERLRLFDESILRSTLAIDGAVADKALALTQALEGHALQIGDVLGSQAEAFDGQVLHGVQAVRKASESVTRQSMAAIEGLANQADMLKHVSEGLLGQINNVTGRFEAQGRVIMTAADALESANSRIDRTLQARQSDLAGTLEQLAGKASDIDLAMRGYSSQLEGSIAEAETRAKLVGEQLTRGAKEQAQLTISEFDRLRISAGSETDRALDELRAKFSTVTREVDEHIGTLSNRFNATSEDMRVRARAALADLEAEQGRLKDQLERLPETTRTSTESMRRTLQDQLRALQQLSTLTSRETSRRDVAPPAQLPPPAAAQQPASSARHHAAIAEAQAAQARAQAAAASGGREGWKLGELLARASDEGPERAGVRAGNHPSGQPGNPASSPAASTDVGINVPGIAKSLDATTAAAIWSRFRTGQRGIMVRSIYSNEGRTIFDEVQRRYRSEAAFKATVDRYLVDFESVLREADQQDPSGRITQSYVVSEGGRVYLFLSHAAGQFA
jgi:hypothetical protein